MQKNTLLKSSCTTVSSFVYFGYIYQNKTRTADTTLADIKWSFVNRGPSVQKQKNTAALTAVTAHGTQRLTAGTATRTR